MPHELLELQIALVVVPLVRVAPEDLPVLLLPGLPKMIDLGHDLMGMGTRPRIRWVLSRTLHERFAVLAGFGLALEVSLDLGCDITRDSRGLGASKGEDPSNVREWRC